MFPPDAAVTVMVLATVMEAECLNNKQSQSVVCVCLCRQHIVISDDGVFCKNMEVLRQLSVCVLRTSVIDQETS